MVGTGLRLWANFSLADFLQKVPVADFFDAALRSFHPFVLGDFLQERPRNICLNFYESFLNPNNPSSGL